MRHYGRVQNKNKKNGNSQYNENGQKEKDKMDEYINLE
jgi:hypothetical protein